MALSPRRLEMGTCIFTYHRVADVPFVDPGRDDWNVLPAVFERQASALAEHANVIPLGDAFQRTGESNGGLKPSVCLTFDDGYVNFATNVLPVLKRYNLRATLFVVTGVVGHDGPMPFDSWSRLNYGKVPADACRPAGWADLETCLASGLVSIGSHSHTHQNGLGKTAEELSQEAEHSRSILRSRLGDAAATMYSYPYGSRRLGQVSDVYIRAVRDAGYSLAVTTDLGLATQSSDLLALPRVEAHGLDGPRALRAKAAGYLAPFRLTDMLRKARR